MKRLVDQYFSISQRQSTIARELRGGLVTFVTMAYILVLNPIIIGGIEGQRKNADITGSVLPMDQVAAATALVAGIMCIAFGAIARYPFAFATGLGINSLLAVSLVPEMSWPEAMGLVVIDGVIIVLLAATGFRTAVFHAIPAPLKAAIAAGIGSFIAFIGFIDSGLVKRMPDAAGSTVPVTFGTDNSVNSWPVAVFAIGVLLIGILVVRKVKGGLLLGIVATTVLAIIVQKFAHLGPSITDPRGWSLNIPAWPTSLGGLPDLSLVGEVSVFGAFTRVGVLSACIVVFALVLSNFFDAMGTMTGLGQEAELTDKDGNLPGIGKALVVEGTGAIAGGVGSVSSNTVYIESAAGIAEGARTGLASIVTGLLFLAAMFFTPLYEIVPFEAAAPALVVVGAMMISQVRHIDFTDFRIAMPAFLTIVGMPFTYSIANGIGLGFVSYAVLSLVSGRARSVHPLLYLIAVVFVVYFLKQPIEDLLT
ncbi:MAG: NCS2 family permease [Nocardiaceae bacterium]|nr:NCS2 family permease [Nocardiaceae bacterium]